MKDQKESRLVIHGPIGSIEVRVRGRLRGQSKRVIQLSFFRMIRPWLKYFRSQLQSDVNICRIPVTSEENHRDYLKFSNRVAKFPSVDSDAGVFGLEVKLKRLELGWTQEILAQKLKTSVCRVSLIERGLTQSRVHTQRRIMEMFAKNESPKS